MTALSPAASHCVAAAAVVGASVCISNLCDDYVAPDVE